jgi:tetratricopeptide (TPR) repeat protein
VAQNEDPPAANPAPENPTHTRDASSTARIENAAGAPASAIGSRALERYQVIGEHGRGGLGRVSRAHDRELGRDVAIKELISSGPVSELRFLREALITARLEHPGIVPVHETGRWPDGTPFYAMKLVSGRPLRDLIAERPTVAIERRRALYGSDSPDEAIAWQAIGAVHQRNDKQDEALAAFRAAARIREARLGDSPLTASSLVAVASVLNEQQHREEALALYDRALRMDRAKLPPGDLQLAAVLVWRAITLNHLERLDEASEAYDEALAIYERAGARSYDMATTFYNRGQLETKRGRFERALRDYARAVALMEQLRGTNADQLIWLLVGQARCLILSGRSGDAIAPLERALKLPAAPEDALDVVRAQYYLGRAHVETRRHVAGGIAMVRAARVTLAADADFRNTELAREIDAWLAARR